MDSSNERVEGIEPSPPAWKAGALPLSYTRFARNTDLPASRMTEQCNKFATMTNGQLHFFDTKTKILSQIKVTSLSLHLAALLLTACLCRESSNANPHHRTATPQPQNHSDVATKESRPCPKANSGGSRIRTCEGIANRFTVCPV